MAVPLKWELCCFLGSVIEALQLNLKGDNKTFTIAENSGIAKGYLLI